MIGAWSNWGLWGACRSGHIDLVELMISRGADDLNGRLKIACHMGHRYLVKYLIQKGATECRKCESMHPGGLSHSMFRILHLM